MTKFILLEESLWNKPSDTSEGERKEMLLEAWSQDNSYKTLMLGHLYSCFILYNHKGGTGKSFYRNQRGSQKVVQGHNPVFQLFIWVTLVQGASEVRLGK